SSLLGTGNQRSVMRPLPAARLFLTGRLQNRLSVLSGRRSYPVRQQTTKLPRQPGGSGFRPRLSRHMRGHREPLSVPERPDIGIAAIPLLAIRCGVAGARVNDSDIAMLHQMDLVAVEPSQRFNVASRRCAGLRGPFRSVLLPYEDGSGE